jgi:hypothetical protein
MTPWLVIAVLIGVWLAIPPGLLHLHELAWAEADRPLDPANKSLGFGGWWFLYVARPIFMLFLAAWLWRLVLCSVLLHRLAKLDLQIVPHHPDRLGGLQFVEEIPRMFGPLAFACSTVLAGRWAHDTVYHGLSLPSLKMQGAVYLVTLLVICLAPLAAFMPLLARVRRRALFQYGALVSDHCRKLHRRWIARENLADDEVLDAPELGSAADVEGLYAAVQKMRSLPVGKRSLLAVVVPAIIPLLAVVALKIPIRELLGKVLRALL